MRDRLIELIQEAEDDYMIYEMGAQALAIEIFKSREEYIADHLIANGVIVPPCKVGDKVYFDTYLHGDSVGVQSHKVINVKYVITTEPSKGGIGAEIPDYAFGETVFLTPEEAEKALKGYKENK